MQGPAKAAERAEHAKELLKAQEWGLIRNSEVQALQERRAELKSQMQSLTERRVLTQVQLGSAEGDARRAIQDRMNALDERIARIDNELNRVDDAISKALAGQPQLPVPVVAEVPPVPTEPPPPGFEYTVPPFGPPPSFFGNAGGLIGALLAGQVLGFALLGLVLWTALRRRFSTGPRLSAEDAGRIDQLQRSVDVIAIEIERVSEAQRFMAKAIGGGVAEAVPVRRSAERVGERGSK